MLKVVFVCAHNSGRSEISEAFFNRYATGVDGSGSDEEMIEQVRVVRNVIEEKVKAFIKSPKTEIQ
ncbi:MAG: hypothetical protein IE884_05405 [Sulfuricurvum sp.]|nr:hypothetical protein [Sulfuricurvum sp.]